MQFTIFLSLNAALIAAIVFTGSILNPPAEAEDPAVQSCAPPAVAAVQGECSPASQDGPAATLPHHKVLAGACAAGDLHVMHYETGDAFPVAATWCEPGAAR
jgi:hypothetical protein